MTAKTKTQFFDGYKMAEVYFLCSLLNCDRTHIENMTELPPEVFRSDMFKDIYILAMKQLYDVGDVDISLISTELKDKYTTVSSTLGSIMRYECLSFNVRLYAKKLKDYRFCLSFHELASSISPSSREGLIHNAEKLIDKWRTVDEEFNMSALIEDAINVVQEASKKSNLLTGVEIVDEILGGYRKGHVTVIGGRPSNGKTAWMVTTANNLLKAKKRILIETIEMTAEEVVNRLVSMRTGITYQQIHTGDFEDVDWKKYGECVYSLKKEELIVYDKNINSSNIISHIKKYRPDIVFVDFIQILYDQYYDDTRRSAQIGETMNKFKNIAKNEDVSIVVMSQIRRPPEYTKDIPRPKLSDLKECVIKGTIVGGEKIEDIVKNKLLIKLKTVNLKTGGIEYKYPVNYIDRGQMNCYQVKTSSGKTITISDKTPLFTGKEWKTVDKLSVNDRIVIEE